jgi:hypothetical protein
MMEAGAGSALMATPGGSPVDTPVVAMTSPERVGPDEKSGSESESDGASFHYFEGPEKVCGAACLPVALRAHGICCEREFVAGISSTCWWCVRHVTRAAGSAPHPDAASAVPCVGPRVGLHADQGPGARPSRADARAVGLDSHGRQVQHSVQREQRVLRLVCAVGKQVRIYFVNLLPSAARACVACRPCSRTASQWCPVREMALSRF